MDNGEGDSASRGGIIGIYFAVMRGIGAILLGAILVIMVAQVVARYVFNDSLIWAEELCRYLLIWITFLFIGLAYERGELVTIDAFTMQLPPKGRFALRLFIAVPCLAFLWLMTTNSISFFGRFTMQTIPAADFIWQALGLGDAAHVSILWVYYSVTIGCVLLILHILASLVVEGRMLFFERSRPARGPG